MKTRRKILRGFGLAACAALALFATASNVAAQDPSLVISGIEQGVTYETSSLTFYVFAKANVGAMSHVNLRMDGGAWIQAIPTGWENNGWIAYYADYEGLANGPHKFDAFPVDTEGNWSYGAVDFFVNTIVTPSDNAFLEWADLPTWADPATIGSLVAYSQVGRPFELYGKSLHYSDHNTGHAALRFARTTGDNTLRDLIMDRYKRLNNDNDSLILQFDSGYFMTSLILFEEYRATGDVWYYNKAVERAEGTWRTRDRWTIEDILENRRLWSDDFYLSDLINSDYYRINQDPMAIDMMCKWLRAHLSALQFKVGDKKGLLRHTTDNTVCWGRGCGWAALGLTEGLRSIPVTDPDYAVIMKGYKDLMDALVRLQCDDDLWGQVVDLTDEWTETSASALFVYALVVGVNNGWLDINEYGPAARSGWLALVRKVDEDGYLADVCIGTTERDTDQDYLDKRTEDGDMHGQAPMIWAAEAMLRDEF